MIYFDNAASSFPKPPLVSKSVGKWLDINGANPGRSGHKPSIEASKIVYNTRESLANMFNITMPENVAFVPNATYGLNVLIQGIMQKGDHAVTTNLEHNSVLRVLNLISSRGVSYDVADVDLYDDCKTIDNILKLINKKTKAVICTQCSNVCGKIMPLKSLSDALPENVVLIVDGSQGAGIIPTDLEELDIDYYCAPSHKGLLGPQGCGFIAIRGAMPKAVIVGGTGSESFSFAQPEYLPDFIESGTLPTPIIRGMYEGIKFIQNIGIEKIYNKKKMLTDYATEQLMKVNGVITYTDPARSEFIGCTCFNVENTHSDKVSDYLAKNDICVRSGFHCAPLFHKKMKTENIGMIRISFGYYNDKNEIDFLIKKLNNYLKN